MDSPESGYLWARVRRKLPSGCQVLPRCTPLRRPRLLATRRFWVDVCAGGARLFRTIRWRWCCARGKSTRSAAFCRRNGARTTRGFVAGAVGISAGWLYVHCRAMDLVSRRQWLPTRGACLYCRVSTCFNSTTAALIRVPVFGRSQVHHHPRKHDAIGMAAAFTGAR